MVTSFQLQMVTSVNYGQLASDAINILNSDAQVMHNAYACFALKIALDISIIS